MTKKEFMQHRKNDHTEFVSECKQNENGWCRFDWQDCWFKHDKETMKYQSTNSDHTNSEMMRRLYDLMEKIAERIALVENKS